MIQELMIKIDQNILIKYFLFQTQKRKNKQ